MSEPRFTAGPWKWWTSNSWRRLRTEGARGQDQSVLEPFVARDGHPDCVVSNADMDLIAAAPDLYEALWQLLDDMGDDGLCVCQDAKEQALEAIRHALGQTAGT